MKNPLVIKAGPRAYQTLQEHGRLTQDMVSHLSAAAGGPKFLVLSQMDRYLFTDWLAGRTEPLVGTGSSIGSWRLACAAQADPATALERLEDNYIEQYYDKVPTAAEVSAAATRILAQSVPQSAARDILNHPFWRLNVVTVRCRRWMASENKAAQQAALLGVIGGNSFSRNNNRAWFERAIFHSGDQPHLDLKQDAFKTHHIPMVEQSLVPALAASGAIPVIMKGVQGIANAPTGVYRDGGMLDYHMDLPVDKPKGLVLMTHFGERIVPGWFDKMVPNRKAANTDDMVLIAPSDEFVASLPNGHVPDRKDFKLYKFQDKERIAAWRESLKRTEALADDFVELLQGPGLISRLQPL